MPMPKPTPTDKCLPRGRLARRHRPNNQQVPLPAMKEEQLHNTEGGEEEGDEAAVEAMEQLGEDICHTEETVSLEGETHPVEGVEDKGEVEQSGELHDGVHSLSSF